MPESPFDFTSTIRIGDGSETPAVGASVTVDRENHRLGELITAESLHIEGVLEAGPDMVALFDAACQHFADEQMRAFADFEDSCRRSMEATREFVNSLLPRDLVEASVHFEWADEPEPQPRGLMAQAHAWLDADEDRMLRSTPPQLEAERATCAHVCGPDPDHECQAAATTVLEHQNLAGGVTRMPLCEACYQSERAALEVEHA